MKCPNGCYRPVFDKDGKEAKRIPLEMEKIETTYTPYDWEHCVQCGVRAFEDKRHLNV